MANVYVKTRQKIGKYGAFALRREGRIPAAVYGKGQGNLNVSMGLKEFKALLKSGQHMVDLVVDDAAPRKAVLKAVQHGTYDSELLHADFRMIDENEIMQLDVPIEIHGEAVGTREGGIMEQETLMMTVRCLPKDLPDVIKVDVSALKVGDMIYADALPVLPGVTYVYHGHPSIVSCRHPQRPGESTDAESAATQPEVMAEKASEARKADKK